LAAQIAICAPLFLVELRANLCSRLCIAVLEWSCVDEPQDERADEILVAFVLVDLLELVLEDVVETMAFTTTWSGEGIGPAKSSLNSCYGFALPRTKCDLVQWQCFGKVVTRRKRKKY
jgi:hypothetical protein